MEFKYLILKGLTSLFVRNLKDIGGEDWGEIKIQEYYPKATDELLDDFNQRRITPRNINEIIRLCDYLLIQNTIPFITCFSNPKYVYELDEVNKENYVLPKCMTSRKDPESAIKHGLLHYVMYYYKDFKTFYGFEWEAEDAYDDKKEYFYWAVKYGHIHIVKWLYSKYCPYNDSIVNVAIYFGHLHIVKWMCKKRCFRSVLNGDRQTVVKAVEGGKLEILKWLYEQQEISFPSNIRELSSNHPKILEWLNEKMI